MLPGKVLNPLNQSPNTSEGTWIHKEILYLCVVYFSGHEHVAARKHGPYLINVIKGGEACNYIFPIAFLGCFSIDYVRHEAFRSHDSRPGALLASCIM